MKKNPGKIRASSTGVGGVGHFNIEVIMNETGAPINMIPYKGASPAMTALMGGHVEISVLSLSLIHPQLQAGKLRALLISKKTPEFPNVPTLKQLGYKNDISSVLFAFYAPVGLPDSVKKTLASPLEKAIKAPEVVKAMEQLGAVEDYVPGPEYKKMMASEYEMVKKLLKGSGAACIKIKRRANLSWYYPFSPKTLLKLPLKINSLLPAGMSMALMLSINHFLSLPV